MSKRALVVFGVAAVMDFLVGNANAQQIQAVGIAGSNDHVYYWWSDATVSSGTTLKNTEFRAHQKVAYPSGKKLVEVAISKSDDHVYYWWTDGTVSSGTSTNPTQYRPPATFNIPSGKTLQAAGIASGDHVYYWWTDGTVSSGTSTDPVQYRGFYGDLVAFGWCYKLQWTARKMTIYPIVYNDASTTWHSSQSGKYWIKVQIGPELVQSSAQGLPIAANMVIPPKQFAPLFPGIEVELRMPPTKYSHVGSWTFSHPDDMVRENNEHVSDWNDLTDVDFTSNGKASAQSCSF